MLITAPAPQRGKLFRWDYATKTMEARKRARFTESMKLCCLVIYVSHCDLFFQKHDLQSHISTLPARTAALSSNTNSPLPPSHHPVHPERNPQRRHKKIP